MMPASPMHPIPEEDIQAYHEWIRKGVSGKLAYMENAIRCDPQELFPRLRQPSYLLLTTSKKNCLSSKVQGLLRLMPVDGTITKFTVKG